MSNLANEQIQAILDGAPKGVRGYNIEDSHEGYSYYFVSILDLDLLREILTLRQEVERLKSERDELAATVERLREVINSERKSLMVRVDAEKILQATPRQNLNAVKRDAWINGYQSTGGIYHGENTEYMSIVRLASRRYPD